MRETPPLSAAPRLRSLWQATPAALARASGAPADAVILDVSQEGGLAGTRAALAAARRLARHRVLVRVPPLAAQDQGALLQGIAAGRPDGVVLPACADGRDVQHLGARLAVAEAEAGLPAGALAIVAEPDAAGLLAVASFRSASVRLAGLMLAAPGACDEAGEGLRRGLLLLGARAAGVPAYAFAPESAAASALFRAGFDGLIAATPGASAAIELAAATPAGSG